jgi:general secretion pathway protein C
MKVGGMSEANQSDDETLLARSGREGRFGIGSILLLTLLVLVALQSARLVWAVVTPAGPVGPVTAQGNRLIAYSGDFDPFFRLQGPTATTSVTSLPLKLFGTRRDSATGQGSAIIATPDGVQSSFAIGEVIMPGVTLASVGNDEVTIDRGGAKEKLFLDQSVPAPVAEPLAQPNPDLGQKLPSTPTTSSESTAPPLVRLDQVPPATQETMEQQ